MTTLRSGKTMLQVRRGLLLAAVVPLVVLSACGSSDSFDGGSFASSDTEATDESIAPPDDDQTDTTDGSGEGEPANDDETDTTDGSGEAEPTNDDDTDTSDGGGEEEPTNDDTDGSGEVVESSDGDQVKAADGVGPTSKQSLRDSSTLRVEQTDGAYGSGLSLREDGSYSSRLTVADDESQWCITYYDSSTNTRMLGCTSVGEFGERQVSGYIVRNMPSTGSESLKRLGFLGGVNVGPFEGASHLPLEESPDGIRSVPLITRSEVIDGHDLSLDGFDGTEAEFEEEKARELDSLVLDIQTGLIIEAVSVGGDLLAAGELVVADEGREHEANIERVKSLIAEADPNDIPESDRGYQQLVSLDDAQERVSYQVPVVTLPDTFELREVFYGPRAKLSRGADVVIQVYRDGLREIVVTSRSDGFDSDGEPNETRDEYLEREWDTSPLDYLFVGYPLEESGWSALVQDPALPPHFWGISNGAVVTVEGLLVSPAVLENVRQQVTTQPVEPVEPVESEARDANS